MELINGRYYPPKHSGRDTLSSGKRGHARQLERRRALLAAGIDPDATNPPRIDPKEACPERGDSL